jgi:hypothetical protein
MAAVFEQPVRGDPQPRGANTDGTAVIFGVAHSIECVVFTERVARAEGSNVGHFIRLFVFGYFHAVELPR